MGDEGDHYPHVTVSAAGGGGGKGEPISETAATQLQLRWKLQYVLSLPVILTLVCLLSFLTFLMPQMTAISQHKKV